MGSVEQLLAQFSQEDALGVGDGVRHDPTGDRFEKQITLRPTVI